VRRGLSAPRRASEGGGSVRWFVVRVRRDRGLGAEPVPAEVQGVSW
jgi:hypothetical protein